MPAYATDLSSQKENIQIMALANSPFRNKYVIGIFLVSAVTLIVFLAVRGFTIIHRPLQGEARAEVIAYVELLTSLDGAEKYYQKVGRLPTDARELREAVLELSPLAKKQIQELIDANSTELVDPWGTPLSITNSSHSVIVTSAGPDKKFGTGDDIIETRK